VQRLHLFEGSIHKWIGRRGALVLGSALAMAGSAAAQTGGASPGENVLNVLQQSFTGPIAKGLALVAMLLAG